MAGNHKDHNSNENGSYESKRERVDWVGRVVSIFGELEEVWWDALLAVIAAVGAVYCEKKGSSFRVLSLLFALASTSFGLGTLAYMHSHRKIISGVWNRARRKHWQKWRLVWSLVGLFFLIYATVSFLHLPEGNRQGPATDCCKEISSAIHTEISHLDSTVQGIRQDIREINKGGDKKRATFNFWVGAFFLFLIIVGVVCIAIAVYGEKKKALLIPGLLSLSIGSMSLVHEISFNFDEISFDLCSLFHCGKSNPPPASSGTIVFQKIYTVGPFRDADIRLTDTTILDSLYRQLLAYDTTLIGISLVGKADKKQLNPKPFRKFGSNENLAMSRAAYIKKFLLSRGGLNVSEDGIQVLSSGAEQVGENITEPFLAMDRVVYVYVLKKEEKKLRE